MGSGSDVRDHESVEAPRYPRVLSVVLWTSLHFVAADDIAYKVEPTVDLGSFTNEQISILEKLNRADSKHLDRLETLLIPDTWKDEMAYCPLPDAIDWAQAHRKFLVVHLPSQIFGAYEFGRIIRWGPVSSGRAKYPTPAGLFYLNWRSRDRRSSDDPAWRLKWYFNFHNVRGLAFHEYALPGRPASHACVRLLRRDAIWLFDWGEEWELSGNGREILEFGTPVLVIGGYDFERSKPWLDAAGWRNRITLPSASRGLLNSIRSRD